MANDKGHKEGSGSPPASQPSSFALKAAPLHELGSCFIVGGSSTSKHYRMAIGLFLFIINLLVTPILSFHSKALL